MSKCLLCQKVHRDGVGGTDRTFITAVLISQTYDLSLT